MTIATVLLFILAIFDPSKVLNCTRCIFRSSVKQKSKTSSSLTFYRIPPAAHLVGTGLMYIKSRVYTNTKLEEKKNSLA